MDEQLTENFSRSEFQCSCGCGAGAISLELVRSLQRVRDVYQAPIRIYSGVRCADHNARIGGVENSAHVPRDTAPGWAVDIRCETSTERYLLLPLLFSRFNRIGIGADFLHVDIDPDKPPDVIWTYYGARHIA